jgi:cytochrome c-type biogenesis protein CcmH/NrfG
MLLPLVARSKQKAKIKPLVVLKCGTGVKSTLGARCSCEQYHRESRHRAVVVSFLCRVAIHMRALQLHPDESELHEAVGELYLVNHSDAEAQTELEKALALDPSRTHSLYLLGRLYVQNRDNEKAVSYLERALRLQPDLSEANGLLGTAYVRLGQFANAVPKLEKSAPLDHYGNVHYQLYLAYSKLGQTELARKALARSQDLRRSSLEHDQALIMGSSQPEPEPQ